MEKRLPTTNENKFITVEVYYNIGGQNFFTGTKEARGYYLSATPQEITNNMKITGAFTGVKKLVLEVKRQSPKALRQAEELAAPMEKELVDYVLAKNNLALK